MITAVESPESPQSGLGIASFAIAIAGVILDFLLVAAAAVAGVENAGEVPESVAVRLGLGLFASVIIQIFGIAFGVVGLTQPNRKRVLPILGLVLNVGLLVALGVLMWTGSTVD